MLTVRGSLFCYFAPDCVADLNEETQDLCGIFVGYQSMIDEHILLILRRARQSRGGEYERLGIAFLRPKENPDQRALAAIMEAAPIRKVSIQ